MLKLSIFIIFILSHQVFANTEKKIIKSVKHFIENTVPEKFQTSLLKLKLDNSISTCSSLETIYVDGNKSKTKKVMSLNPICFNFNFEEASKELTQAIQFQVFKEIFEHTVIHWSDNGKKLIKNSKLRWEIFKNNFYYTPWSLKVDLFENQRDSYLDFILKSSLAYIQNQNLAFENPSLYQFLSKNFFKGVHYHEVDEEILKLNSLQKPEENLNHANIKLVRQGNEAFYLRYKMIKEAKDTIILSYFSWFQDAFGMALLGLLLEKLQEGVKVKILFDGRGSFIKSSNDIIQELVNHGAEIKVYNPIFINITNLWRTFKVGLLDGIIGSNHDKIILVDGKKVITGGRNIGDKYFAANGEINGILFDDTDVYMEFKQLPISVIKAFNVEYYSVYARKIKKDLRNLRPKINKLKASLKAMQEWITVGKLSADSKKVHPELENFPSLIGYNHFQITFDAFNVGIGGYDNTSVLLKGDELTDKLFKMIEEAKNEIIIQNPYIVLTKSMFKKLIEAGKRGVKITFVASSHLSTDSLLTINDLAMNWNKILDAIPNSKMYAYLGPEKIHSKVFIFDNQLSVVGSYNLDSLSQNINSEFSVVIDSTEFADALKSSINNIIDGSFEYDHQKNIGPKDIPDGSDIFKFNRKFYFMTILLRPWI